MDDEDAVQIAFKAVYPDLSIHLCLFHVNKSILRRLAELKLISFFRNCHRDDEIYIYKKIKEIFALCFLPEDKINESFNTLQRQIRSFTRQNCNKSQNEKFAMFFDYLERNYFGNLEKLKLICKYKMLIRTTNLIESVHSTFNKSSLLGKHQTLVRVVSGKSVFVT